MNRVILMGRLTRDPEVRYSQGGNRGGYQQGTRPAPSSAIGDGFMNIPDGVEDEGLPFN